MKSNVTICFGLICAGGLLLIGCASTSTARSDNAVNMAGIPHVTPLYEKAADMRVHKFRKTHQDQMARNAHNLADACDTLLADVQTWDKSANLTSAGADEQNIVKTDINTLKTNLEQLRNAARRGDAKAMHSAHDEAAAAYARIQKKINL